MSMWAEALGHCRNTKILRTFITNEIDIKSYKDMSFESIFTSIHDLCLNKDGLGPLVVYDITSAICRFYKINIDKVYIVGNGPKNAVRILGLKTKKQTLRHPDIKLSYVDINDIITTFEKYGYTIDNKIALSKNGDDFESYICKWQKTVDEMHLYRQISCHKTD